MIITKLQFSTCLLNGSSVDLKCVLFGFPRPQIFFFQGPEQIVPGEGNFSRFKKVSFDTVRLTMAQQADRRDYACVATMGNVELNRSRPETPALCGKYCVEPFSYHACAANQHSYRSASQALSCIHISCIKRWLAIYTL